MNASCTEESEHQNGKALRRGITVFDNGYDMEVEAEATSAGLEVGASLIPWEWIDAARSHLASQPSPHKAPA
jgi:hypothetical protein